MKSSHRIDRSSNFVLPKTITFSTKLRPLQTAIVCSAVNGDVKTNFGFDSESECLSSPIGNFVFLFFVNVFADLISQSESIRLVLEIKFSSWPVVRWLCALLGNQKELEKCCTHTCANGQLTQYSHTRTGLTAVR